MTATYPCLGEGSGKVAQLEGCLQTPRRPEPAMSIFLHGKSIRRGIEWTHVDGDSTWFRAVPIARTSRYRHAVSR
jgi:hypothetical protein